MRWLVTGLTASTLLAAAQGCGDGKARVDTSTEEATVKGTVSIDGAPVSGGQITFDPSNYQRSNIPPHSEPIGKDGTYSTKTLVGENIVTLGGDIVTKDAILQFERRKVDVKRGENTFDFKVERKAAK